jgi:DNA repair exonuclease SbcCD ATPase subunit
MVDQAQKLDEIIQDAEERVERLVKLSIQAEIDSGVAEDLRTEIKRWIDSIKADVLVHFALHMVGFGTRFIQEVKGKLETADLEEDKKEKLQQVLEDSQSRVNEITKLSLKAERNNDTSEDLRTEIKRWIDSVDDITISHFSTHLIGSGVVFAGYVKAKREEENNG